MNDERTQSPGDDPQPAKDEPAKDELLSREQVHEVVDVEYDVVSVPEWNGKIRIRSLTGSERDAYEQSLVKEKGGVTKMNLRGARARLVMMAAVDAEGKVLFVGGDEDHKWLTRKNARALTRVSKRILTLSGMTEEEEEELLGNSESGPSAASTSSSPGSSE